MKGQEVLNLMRKTDKYSESSIESSAHTQILKQQKQLNSRNHHILININTKSKWIQFLHQKTPFGKLN
jgi:hypothetical protein